MDESGGASRRPDVRGSVIPEALATIHEAIRGFTEGAVADYIPELGKADPDLFGIAVATVDGKVYTVGDAARPFSIQSISKPFMYGYALREFGEDFVLQNVGVEPTGEAFNSIVLDAKNNRPFNPMVNAGAIAISGLTRGNDVAARRAEMRGMLDAFAGRRLGFDEAVFASEMETGHRNRAIAYMMLNSGMVTRDVGEILDTYFAQCSVVVDATDLAVMAATLASGGRNPLTGREVLGQDAVRDVLTVMSTCGMYDYAGQWAFEVGMPAKSGVSGGVIAVVPGQLGIGVYSPRLDNYGNSVRGIRVCQQMSRTFGLHAYELRRDGLAAVRREYGGDVVRSKRGRTPREMAVIESGGARSIVFELQGALHFTSGERLIRRLEALDPPVRHVVIDFARVQSADAAAVRLLALMFEAAVRDGRRVVLTGLDPDGPLRESLSAGGALAVAELCDDIDRALESCEEEILAAARASVAEDRTRLGLGRLDLFAGLDREDLRLLEGIVRPMHFEPGETILRAGDSARMFFVVARGSVTVTLGTTAKRSRRIACIGPGMSFGEMALLDGGVRSADVTADERVICYAMSVEELREIAELRPQIMTAILSNLLRDFSDRLRRANREVQALE